jgi:uncharacterized protein
MEIEMNKSFSKILCGLALLTLFSVSAIAKEITVRGTLQKTVESGGWLIKADKQKYLLLNAADYKNQSWFTESSAVEAVGQTRSDVMTIYQEGTPFQARSMHAVDENQTTQSVVTKQLTKVVVTGDSLVKAMPDTAILTLSVVTQATRALDAQQDNARKTDAVIRALKSAVGAGAEIKTSGYNLQPQRVYKENQPPTIVGYEARNTITVTLSDLSKVGSLIDAAAQSGANDVSGIAFTLTQDRPARDEALKQATREAISKAQVIAGALGGKVARVAEVHEEGTVRPIPMYNQMEMKSAQASTPIEIGTLDVTSRVQLVVEVEAV